MFFTKYKNCIRNWLKDNEICPLCRDISQKPKIKWDYNEVTNEELDDIKLSGEFKANNFDWKHNTSTKDNYCLIL